MCSEKFTAVFVIDAISTMWRWK